MKKRIVALLVAVLLIASVLVPATAEAKGKPYYKVDKNYKLVVNMVECANRTIDGLVLVAKLTPYDDVDWLLCKVNQIAKTTIRNAKVLGYTVECEYETHIIDRRVVVIDPLYVVNPLPENKPTKP